MCSVPVSVYHPSSRCSYGAIAQAWSHCAADAPFASRCVAVSTDDFVSFFQELKQADYLTACLMHKHFDSVRHKALNAINRAFRSPQPGSETPLPLAKLVPMLCLEDVAEARTLVEHFQLETRGDNVLLKAPQVTCTHSPE